MSNLFHSLCSQADRWLTTTDFDPKDLGLHRIVFASWFLISLPWFSWVSKYPDSIFDPPPGPFRFFDQIPPEWFFRVLELAIAVLLVAVLIGWNTKPASIAVTVLSLVGFGFAYSFGKIDHNILVVVTPGFMACAGWGESFSLDSMRTGSSGQGSQLWVMRIFAVAVGIAMGTAFLPKLRRGWLDLDTQATWAETVGAQENGLDSLVGGWLLRSNLPVKVWEVADWSAVLLEGSIIFAAVSWLWFRRSLAALAIFHLGVYLVMGITFWPNLMVYASFVRWSQLPYFDQVSTQLDSWLKSLSRLNSLALAALALITGVVVYVVPGREEVARAIGITLLFVGGAIGGLHLLNSFRGLTRLRSMDR